MLKMKLTIYEVAKAVNGQLDTTKFQDQALTSAEFDSRNISKGSLFVPLKGERDGHEFLDSAKKNGAIATFWSKEIPLPIDFPAIVVEDVLKAFQDLASYYLEKMNPTIIGITGTNGKTSTKDMTAAVLASHYHTHKTLGNHNNEIGMPYTILSMPDDTQKIVLEMGQDHMGDLHLLSTIAKPDIAAITIIGESHLEYFKTRKNIAIGKMQIADGLKENGLLIIPGDEPLLDDLKTKVDRPQTTFGWDNQSDIFATIIKEEKTSIDFELSFIDGTIHLPIPGKYNAKNAMVAAYIGLKLDVPQEKIIRALEQVELTKNRTEWKKASNGAEVLSDVYNASPTAMALALDGFAKMAVNIGGKRIAVLGDMLELGDTSKELHESMKAHISPDEIKQVFLYGEQMRALHEAIKEIYPEKALVHYQKEEKEQLIHDLKETLNPEDMVLLKASNSMGLGEVVSSLVE
jgi:UDP-N-acetylmuramoyl-tripeptide--D-alanyl-D-alanine ligase